MVSNVVSFHSGEICRNRSSGEPPLAPEPHPAMSKDHPMTTRHKTRESGAFIDHLREQWGQNGRMLPIRFAGHHCGPAQQSPLVMESVEANSSLPASPTIHDTGHETISNEGEHEVSADVALDETLCPFDAVGEYSISLVSERCYRP